MSCFVCAYTAHYAPELERSSSLQSNQALVISLPCPVPCSQSYQLSPVNLKNKHSSGSTLNCSDLELKSNLAATPATCVNCQGAPSDICLLGHCLVQCPGDLDLDGWTPGHKFSTWCLILKRSTIICSRIIMHDLPALPKSKH